MDMNMVDEKSQAVATLGQLCMNAPRACLPRIVEVRDALEKTQFYAQPNVRYQTVSSYI
jgi:hypothetical protein